MEAKTIAEKREWIKGMVGASIAEQYDDDGIAHTYRAMEDYGLSVHDSDRWAWLNTLFGYDIGADHAMGICAVLDDRDQDALELRAEDKEEIQEICGSDLGYHLKFDAWVKETPDVIGFVWADRIVPADR